MTALEQAKRRRVSYPEGDGKPMAETDRHGNMMLDLIMFDPYNEYLSPPLQGFRLVDGRYEPMRDFPLCSAVLGLELRQENSTLRLYDVKTDERLPTVDEEARARREAQAGQQQAEARLRAEEDARKNIEARVVALEAELARLRAERDQQA